MEVTSSLVGQGPPLICLLCNDYFDEKPSTSLDQTYQLDSVFKGGFQLFCKLLKLKGNFPERLSKIGVLQHANCSYCHAALRDLMQLENIIEETKSRQQEVLRALKHTIIDSKDKQRSQLTEIWKSFRISLIDDLHNCLDEEPLTITNDVDSLLFDPTSVPADCSDEESDSHDDYDDPLETEEMPSTSATETIYVLPNQPIELPMSIDSTVPSSPQSPIKRGRGRPRKTHSSLNISSNSPIKSCLVSVEKLPLSDEEIKTGRRGRKQVISTKVEKDEPFSPNLMEDSSSEVDSDYKPEVKKKMRSSAVKKRKRREINWNVTQVIRRNGTVKLARTVRLSKYKDQLFYKLSDNYLFHRGVLIEFHFLSATHSQLICQEVDCDIKLSMNGFDEFKEHVNQYHNLLLETPGESLIRHCPLCNVEFLGIKNFRRHVFDDHFPSTVCEVCWKTAKTQHTLTKHRYTHMNEEDRAKEIERNAEQDESEKSKRGEKIESKLTEKAIKRKKHQEKQILKNLKQEEGPKGRKRRESNWDLTEHLTAKGKVKYQRIIKKSKYKDGDVFYTIGDSFLFHKGVLLRYSATEFTCMEVQCDNRIVERFLTNPQHLIFEDFKKHVKDFHKKLLETPGESLIRSCPICNVDFKGIKNFRRHIFDYHKPQSICPVCWKPLRSLAAPSWALHIWSHLSEEEKSNKQPPPPIKKQTKEEVNQDCEDDEATFSAFSPKPIEKQVLFCSSCPKIFHDLSCLKAHEHTHLPDHLRRKHTCDLCGVSFLNRVSLNSHMDLVHRPDLVKRKLECRICGKVFYFRRREAFKDHMRSHTGERPFQCDKCPKAFFSKKTLTAHQKGVHATSRSWQCQFCEKSYKIQTVLRLHQRKAHEHLVEPTDLEMRFKVQQENRPGFIGPKIMFPCEICNGNVYFPNRSRLKVHLKHAHQVGPYCK